MDILQTDKLFKKKISIDNFINNDLSIQDMINDPLNDAISFGFPITDLLKRTKQEYIKPYNNLFSYNLTSDGFKQWCPQNLIKIFARKFNSIKLSSSPTEKIGLWRNIGDEYFIIHYFGNVIYCKKTSSFLHIPLININFSLFDSSFTDFLLILLEFSQLHNCNYLRLYFQKEYNDSITMSNFKKILSNLNWIGGKIVPNEDRDQIIDSLSQFDLLSSDENFLIIQFET
ncbi:Ornithine decarboxylase antizyme 1 [Maudiozyma exigua]|uniref:Ornithine decarboxylase antizyme 1 n=1 Tax=Maudiozyma exigua TaxID=34358 RepID=A0A9P7BBA4_MAUEX|nr:Ornithine decarboxylase antizyme 1 [Kazachstania exigua]